MSDSAINLNGVKTSLRELTEQVERVVRHPLLPEVKAGAETIAFKLIQGIVQAYQIAVAANDMGAVIMITDELSRSTMRLGDAILANTPMTSRSSDIGIVGVGHRITISHS